MIDQDFLPQFKLANGIFSDEHHQVCLKNRPIAQRLIEAFLRNPGLVMTREELVNHVYASFDPATKSARFRAVLGQNITKLISRTRSYLEVRLNDGPTTWIEFFPYDHAIGGWHLYRLTQEFIVSRFREALSAS